MTKKKMKNFKTTIACILFSLAGAVAAQDRWDGPDKPKHVAASAISAVVVESIFAEDLPVLARFTIAMLPGAIKEMSDSRRGGSGISGKDFVANALGVGFGMAGYHIIVRHNYVGVELKF